MGDRLILATFDPLINALKFHIFRSPSPPSSHLREIEFIFEQFSDFYDNMKSVAVLTVLAMVFALLVLTSPQNSEVAAKLPAEIEREATKPPQEVADEAAEAVAELKTEL